MPSRVLAIETGMAEDNVILTLFFSVQSNGYKEKNKAS